MVILNGGYKEYKLRNGLVVALQKTPTQTIAARLRVNYGSSDEKKGEEGMAHFLEHCLVTGGSQKYDPVQADEIRSSLGYSNAFTNIGRILFDTEILSEDLQKWLDFISQHVFYPRFNQERINGERERVLREISDAKSNPLYEQNKEFKRLLYRSHPKGRFILGRENVVKNAGLKKIKQFHERGFHPNNMDLVVVGGLPENTEKLIKQYFGNEMTGKNTRKIFPESEHLDDKIILYRPAKERLNLENPEESSAQICLACIMPNETHPDNYTLRFISHILGGDTNSRLFQNLSLRKGLAYFINTNYDGSYNTGELQINSNVPATRIEEAVNTIFDEIQKLKTQKIDDKEVERLKKIARYHLVRGYDSNSGHVSAIETKLDYNLTPEMHMQEYNKITADKIFEIANKYLPDRNTGKYLLHIRNPLQA